MGSRAKRRHGKRSGPRDTRVGMYASPRARFQQGSYWGDPLLFTQTAKLAEQDSMLGEFDDEDAAALSAVMVELFRDSQEIPSLDVIVRIQELYDKALARLGLEVHKNDEVLVKAKEATEEALWKALCSIRAQTNP